MSEPTRQTVERIKEVAKMRIEGATWKVIANVYGYSTEGTARQTLTQEHPDLWKEEYEKARELYLNQIEAEAILTQRSLMQSRRKIKTEKGERYQEIDPELNQKAAHSLLAHTAKLRAQKHEISGLPTELKIILPDDHTEKDDEQN